MSRHTTVQCDSEGCTWEDGTDGETNWITVKRRKAINVDLCSEACLAVWAQTQPVGAVDTAQRAFAGV
jgi:hypothetical protein